MKSKRALIEISLVEESAETTKEKIEKEIFEELSKTHLTIPWLKTIEKVTVIENL